MFLSFCIFLNFYSTRLITMRSKPDYVETVDVVLNVVAVHKGLVGVDKSLS